MEVSDNLTICSQNKSLNNINEGAALDYVEMRHIEISIDNILIYGSICLFYLILFVVLIHFRRRIRIKREVCAIEEE